MQLNGARILIECLIREGVNIIFGFYICIQFIHTNHFKYFLV